MTACSCAATRFTSGRDAGAVVGPSPDSVFESPTSTTPSVTVTSTCAASSRTANAVPTARTAVSFARTMNGLDLSCATSKSASPRTSRMSRCCVVNRTVTSLAVLSNRVEPSSSAIRRTSPMPLV